MKRSYVRLANVHVRVPYTQKPITKAVRITDKYDFHAPHDRRLQLLLLVQHTYSLTHTHTYVQSYMPSWLSAKSLYCCYFACKSRYFFNKYATYLLHRVAHSNNKKYHAVCTTISIAFSFYFLLILYLFLSFFLPKCFAFFSFVCGLHCK